MKDSLTYIIIPILAVALVFIFLYILKKKERETTASRLNRADGELITSTRLRAYERYAILLERMNPNSLLINKITPGMSYRYLQIRLLGDIRREFEHNAAQQIYISEVLWEEITEARESLEQLINSCAEQCQPDDPAEKLALIILEVYNTPEETAITVALRDLKTEVKDLYS